MPAPSANPEVDAIEQAYAAQVQALFRQLITNVGDEGVTRQGDEQSVAKFTAGLAIAKRARDLALKAVAPIPRATLAKARRSKRKAK